MLPVQVGNQYIIDICRHYRRSEYGIKFCIVSEYSPELL